MSLEFCGIGTALNFNLSKNVWRSGTANMVTETKSALIDLIVTGTALNDTLSVLGHVFDAGEGNNTLVGGIR